MQVKWTDIELHDLLLHENSKSKALLYCLYTVTHVRQQLLYIAYFQPNIGAFPLCSYLFCFNPYWVWLLPCQLQWKVKMHLSALDTVYLRDSAHLTVWDKVHSFVFCTPTLPDMFSFSFHFPYYRLTESTKDTSSIIVGMNRATQDL